MSSFHIPPYGGGGTRGGGRGGVSPAGAGGSGSGTGGVGGKQTSSPARRRGGAVGDEGRPVSRQLSRSYFVPRSLEGYERHLRQIHCEGYLQRQSRTSGAWRRRWFLLKDGYLSYFQDQEEAEGYRSKEGGSQFHHHPSSLRQLSLDCVEAVRTEEKIRPLVFRVISSHRDDLVLRAESKEAMNDWLFGFHRALASIIASVVGNKRGGGGRGGDAQGGWDPTEAGGEGAMALGMAGGGTAVR
ncbi:unnamed protein product, partial [Ectocarpus sp. 8 AP-2014]